MSDTNLIKSPAIYLQEAPRQASQLVEIPIASGASTVQFPDIPELRSDTEIQVNIRAIRLITPKVLTNGPLTGTANTPLADLKKISLQLYAEGWVKGYNIPVLVLNDVADSDSTAATTIPFRNQATRFDNWRIAWQKSKVIFAQGQSASQASVLLLEVEFERMIFSKQLNSWVGVEGPA